MFPKSVFASCVFPSCVFPPIGGSPDYVILYGVSSRGRFMALSERGNFVGSGQRIFIDKSEREQFEGVASRGQLKDRGRRQFVIKD